MTIKQLSSELSKGYNNAPKGRMVTMVHLFAIKFASEINNSEYTVEDIVTASTVPNSYGIEVRKGIRLAEYVKVK